MTTYDAGDGGWVRVTFADDLDRPAFVRFVDDGGRLVSDQVVLAGGVDTDALRRLQLGRIEAWANGAGAKPLRAGMGRTAPDPAAELGEVVPRRRRGRRVVTVAVPVLDVPDGGPGAGRGHGDDFYRQVADVYRHAAAEGRPPVLEIASAAAGGVVVAKGDDPTAALPPPSTVHRWIREARRRGFLPPGRVGKSG